MASQGKENVPTVKRATKGVAAREPAAESEGPAVRVARAPRPAKCRQFARARMAEAMPELVGALLERSAEGSLGHLKLLVQLSGLDELGAAKRKRGKSVTRKLLDEWRTNGNAE